MNKSLPLLVFACALLATGAKADVPVDPGSLILVKFASPDGAAAVSKQNICTDGKIVILKAKSHIFIPNGSETMTLSCARVGADNKVYISAMDMKDIYVGCQNQTTTTKCWINLLKGHASPTDAQTIPISIDATATAADFPARPAVQARLVQTQTTAVSPKDLRVIDVNKDNRDYNAVMAMCAPPKKLVVLGSQADADKLPGSTLTNVDLYCADANLTDKSAVALTKLPSDKVSFACVKAAAAPITGQLAYSCHLDASAQDKLHPVTIIPRAVAKDEFAPAGAAVVAQTKKPAAKPGATGTAADLGNMALTAHEKTGSLSTNSPPTAISTRTC